MDKLAMHIEHYKAGAIGGIDHHNRRTQSNHANPDIDVSRSQDNIELVRPAGGTLWQAVSARKEALQAAGARITKNSVLCSEWIVTAPQRLRDPSQAESDELREWGMDLIGWFKKEGLEVASAVIHTDETTVHAHIDVLPVTQDGRFSRKELYTREKLQHYHSSLSAHLTEWGIERGDSTQGKFRHTVPLSQYKKKAEEERKALESSKEQLGLEVGKLKAELDLLIATQSRRASDGRETIQNCKSRRSITGKETYVLDSEQWLKVQNAVLDSYWNIQNISKAVKEGLSRIEKESFAPYKANEETMRQRFDYVCRMNDRQERKIGELQTAVNDLSYVIDLYDKALESMPEEFRNSYLKELDRLDELQQAQEQQQFYGIER